jgi:hypothetical protein
VLNQIEAHIRGEKSAAAAAAAANAAAADAVATAKRNKTKPAGQDQLKPAKKPKNPGPKPNPTGNQHHHARVNCYKKNDERFNAEGYMARKDWDTFNDRPADEEEETRDTILKAEINSLFDAIVYGAHEPRSSSAESTVAGEVAAAAYWCVHKKGQGGRDSNSCVECVT